MLLKLLVFVLILSILKIVVEIGRFVLAFIRNEEYTTTKINGLLTLLSISYVFTIIICGFE